MTETVRRDLSLRALSDGRPRPSESLKKVADLRNALRVSSAHESTGKCRRTSGMFGSSSSDSGQGTPERAQ